MWNIGSETELLESESACKVAKYVYCNSDDQFCG